MSATLPNQPVKVFSTNQKSPLKPFADQQPINSLFTSELIFLLVTWYMYCDSQWNVSTHVTLWGYSQSNVYLQWDWILW